MASLLRITFGVLFGINILIGLALLAERFPVDAQYVWGVAMGFGVGGFWVWYVSHCLWTGVTSSRSGRHERSTSPFHFWFFIVFYSLLACSFVALGVCSALAPELLGLRCGISP
jgi:hypothetical protein